METLIWRNRIQFEDDANQINDGNESMHCDRIAQEWAGAATDYLQRHGGGEALVRHEKDHHSFLVDGDKAVAEAADDAGWAAVGKYVQEQIAETWYGQCGFCGLKATIPCNEQGHELVDLDGESCCQECYEERTGKPFPQATERG